MATRSTPFAPEEWYHCYNRGVEKRDTFLLKSDYQRFMHLLYLCNSDTTLHRSNIFTKNDAEIYQQKRGKPLVAIGAYALMPNHFHLQLKEIVDGGISTFMQKLGTAYTMYFNIKNKHVGGLFIKPFRAKHIDNDEYLNYLVQYIHLNAAELFEKKWKEGITKEKIKILEDRLLEYPYSSFVDYHSGNIRPERDILNENEFAFLGDHLPKASDILEEARMYYIELQKNARYGE